VRTLSEHGERQESVQFELEDGRIIEQLCAPSARRSDELAPGRKVLVWYDADDPMMSWSSTRTDDGPTGPSS
jgi:hypothetical protein